LLLARAAGVALLWIARPAVQANLPPLSSRRALIEIAVGLLAAAWTGWHAPLLLAVTLAAVRVAMSLSYRAWGGIRSASLTWVRVAVAVAVLAIALLPISSLYSAAR
jgi:hypothetical protein